jgi:hypothetical protein
MENLLDMANAYGVRDHVLWVNAFVSNEELALMLACTTIYITPFDECTPTSVSYLASR